MRNIDIEQRHARLLLQLAGTAAALAWIPGNVPKLLTMIIIWLLGFGNISRVELLIMLGVDILFTIMNLGALRQRIFWFEHPDALGLPVYEYFMWGFYVLHTIRFVRGPPVRGSLTTALLMAVVFAVPFSTIADSDLLLLVTAVVLAACFALFHEPADFAYTGYMVLVGVVIEYVGVGTGQWHYPTSPFGGVPIWFITMWGGVGLFARRLLLSSFLRW